MTERVIAADTEKGDIDWVSLAALFSSDEDQCVDAFMDGIKATGGQLTVLARVTNIVYDCGQPMVQHEEIIQLPDGRVVFTDSAEGQHYITEGPVEDVGALLDRIEEILTA